MRVHQIYAKLDANFFTNQKVIRAGLAGAVVYLHALCQNAQRGAQGWIPLADVSPWYVARMTPLTEDEARDGLEAACNADLVTCNDDIVTIVGWDDEWGRHPLTNAERQAKHRERKKGVTTTSLQVTSNVTSNGSERSERSEREPRYAASSHSGFLGTGPDPDRAVRTDRTTAQADQPESDLEKPEKPARRLRQAAPDSNNAATNAQEPAVNAAPRAAGSARSKAFDAAFIQSWSPPESLAAIARTLGCDLAHELSTFRCVARERSNRYKSADALEAAFEKHMHNSRDKGRVKPPTVAAPAGASRRRFFRDPLTDERYEVDENGDRLAPHSSDGTDANGASK